jgi:hypothetical protein
MALDRRRAACPDYRTNGLRRPCLDPSAAAFSFEAVSFFAGSEPENVPGARLYFAHQNFEVLSEPRKQLPLGWVGCQVPDHFALGYLDV